MPDSRSRIVVTCRQQPCFDKANVIFETRKRNPPRRPQRAPSRCKLRPTLANVRKFVTAISKPFLPGKPAASRKFETFRRKVHDKQVLRGKMEAMSCTQCILWSFWNRNETGATLPQWVYGRNSSYDFGMRILRTFVTSFWRFSVVKINCLPGHCVPITIDGHRPPPIWLRYEQMSLQFVILNCPELVQSSSVFFPRQFLLREHF